MSKKIENEPLMEKCNDGNHKFYKLSDHPRNLLGHPVCPYCLVIGKKRLEDEIEALKKELDTANKSYMWKYEAMNTNQQWFEAQEYWGDDKDEGWVSQYTFDTLEEARAFAENYFINNHPWRVIQCSDIYRG